MYKYQKIKLKNGATKDEHRLVWIKNNGEIPKGMVIHHIDGNKRNNDIHNLMLMSRSEHTSLHNKGIARVNRRRPSICGTTSAYRRGCRCSLCKEHMRQKMSAYRARLLLSSLKEN